VLQDMNKNVACLTVWLVPSMVVVNVLSRARHVFLSRQLLVCCEIRVGSNEM
jgi:hypothetical protein